MQMQNWLVSTVLGLTLAGAAGCGPQEEPLPTASPEATLPSPAPQQEDEGGTVSAMATTTITWADFAKTKVTGVYSCITVSSPQSCSFCASSPAYSVEYSTSGCTAPYDIDHTCNTCVKAWYPNVTQRVALPDGDLIDVTIEHGVTAPDGVEFRLESGPNVTWWKQVGLVGGGDHWRVWNEGGNSWCNWPSSSTAGCNTNSQWANIVTSPGTYFVFSKAKGIFAVHTEMYKLYNLSEQLTGGDRVTFRWVQD